jgi:hypothetical protein
MTEGFNPYILQAEPEKRLTAQQRYLLTEKGKAAKQRAQAKYLASEKGRVARGKAAAAQSDARKTDRASASFDRLVRENMYRAKNHIAPWLRTLTTDARDKYLAECTANNPPLREALKQCGV